MNNEKNNLLMNKIECFFDNEFNKNILIRILNNEFNISLRVIDWFVTNYCKKFNTMYNVKYYEILNCFDDNFNSLSLLEWENIYELEWSYEKTIETDYLPEDIICTCTIQVEATDLNDTMNQTEISITISNGLTTDNLELVLLTTERKQSTAYVF